VILNVKEKGSSASPSLKLHAYSNTQTVAWTITRVRRPRKLLRPLLQSSSSIAANGLKAKNIAQDHAPAEDLFLDRTKIHTLMTVWPWVIPVIVPNPVTALWLDSPVPG